MSETAGETQPMKTVLLFPPSESCSIRVSRESRYGTWLPFFIGSPSTLMTFPSASRPQLMLIASFSRSPVALVRFWRSEPARSTKWNLESRTSSWIEPSAAGKRCSSESVKMAWEREETEFISVLPVVRAIAPASSSCSVSAHDETTTSVSPLTLIVPSGASRIMMFVRSRCMPAGASRSLISSL